MPEEGFLGHVELRPFSPGRRTPGFRVLFAELAGDHDARGLTTRLAPGRYRLSAFQRTCSGTCSVLDAPTERCFRDVWIRSGSRRAFSIAVDVAGPCRIAAHAGPPSATASRE